MKLKPTESSSLELSPAARKAAATLGALIAAQGLSAVVAADDALAATKDGTVRLDKVTVEDRKTTSLASPKFTQPLVDTPQTLTIVTPEIYEQQGAQSLSDVLRNAPGVAFTAGEGGNMNSGDAFYMRGFEVGGNGGNSIFVDGIRDNGAISRDVYNLEQVEIAKGPAGADNGRGATSGYINLSSKQPRLQPGAELTGSYGFDETSSIERQRATLDVNRPLAAAGMAFRLNALWQEGGVPGRDYVEQNRWSLAPSLAFGLGTPTRVILSSEHTRQDNVPDGGVPSATNPEITTNTPLTSPRGQSNFYGLPDFDHEDVVADRYTLRAEHDFDHGARLSSIVRYGRNERAAEVSLPNWSATTLLASRNRSYSERETEILASQTNFTLPFSTGRATHALSTGLELTREKAFSPGWTGAGTVAGTDLVHPELRPAFATPRALTRTGAQTDARTDTAALYAFDTARLNERWHLNAGLRVEHYQTKYESRPASGSTTPSAAIETDNTLLTGKAGLVYKPHSNGSFYLSYGNSIRPPGTNFTFSTSATNADNPSLDPQEAHNYELGAKWDLFHGRLLATAAFFRSLNTNVALTDPVTGLVVQTTEQQVQGVELGASGRLTTDWLVFAGFAYLDSEYKSPSAPAASSNGAELQWTPRLSGSLWTTYRLPFGVTIGGGARYLGSTRRQLSVLAPSTAGGEAPSHWTFDLVGSYQVTPHLSLRLNVLNFTDELYAKSLNNNGGRYNPGAPRNFVLSASYRL